MSRGNCATIEMTAFQMFAFRATYSARRKCEGAILCGVLGIDPGLRSTGWGACGCAGQQAAACGQWAMPNPTGALGRSLIGAV
jgi:hypothetical protein